MKKNRVSLAMLAAISVCGVVQSVAHAQGGVLIPDPIISPTVRAVPNVVEYPAKKVERTEAPMPVPHPVKPMTATGRIVHVQNVRGLKVMPSPPAASAAMPLPMGMGGFVTPRPVIGVGEPTLIMPTTAAPNN